MRTTITGIYICIYLALVNFWIYKIANGQLERADNRVLGYAISMFIATCLFIDYKYGNNNPFIDVAFSCLIINFILNIVNYTGVFGYDTPSMFYSFNGLVFVVTSLILYWGRKHGLFNE